ncbi:MAG TPA: class I SAM-dependent methyltransferase [Acidimicrobiales bacterium]
MDRHDWDERYGGDDLVWTAQPNRFLVEQVAGLTPGTAVDLGCGEGRNAVWLAEQGWRVTGVDFSVVGLDKGRRLATDRGVEVEWVAAAAEEYVPPPEGFDLVAVFYLQLPQPVRTAALGVAARAVAPGGTLLVVAHDVDNLTRGVGGPPDPAVLYDAASTVEVITATGLVVQTAGKVIRTVETDAGPREAVDTLVRARRPAAGT